MKWFVILGVLTGLYMLMLAHTTDIVMEQTQQLQARYQQAAAYADSLTTARQP
jgi:hypothetical protein